MVAIWSPEPPRDLGDDIFSTAIVGDIVIDSNSSDSDDDNMYNGYELLPQAPVNLPELLDSETEDNIMTDNVAEDLGSTDCVLEPASPMTATSSAAETLMLDAERREEVRSLWSSSGANMTMGDEQVAQVRAAMANVTLPPSAIPAWAATVSEDQWKQHLMDRMHSLQEK